MNDTLILERLRRLEDNHREGECALRENQRKQDELTRALLRIKGALEVLRTLDGAEYDPAMVAHRIRSLEEEAARGDEQLRTLERSRQEIANGMTRIEGALAVLEEMLDEARRRPADDAPEPPRG